MCALNLGAAFPVLPTNICRSPDRHAFEPIYVSFSAPRRRRLFQYRPFKISFPCPVPGSAGLPSHRTHPPCARPCRSRCRRQKWPPGTPNLTQSLQPNAAGHPASNAFCRDLEQSVAGADRKPRMPTDYLASCTAASHSAPQGALF